MFVLGDERDDLPFEDERPDLLDSLWRELLKSLGDDRERLEECLSLEEPRELRFLE